MILAAELMLIAVALVSMARYLVSSRPIDWAYALLLTLVMGWIL